MTHLEIYRGGVQGSRERRRGALLEECKNRRKREVKGTRLAVWEVAMCTHISPLTPVLRMMSLMV